MRMSALKFGFAASLMLATMSGTFWPLSAQAQGSDSQDCVIVKGSQLVNKCGYTIDLAWCVVGAEYAGWECNGDYRATTNVRAYGSWPHEGGSYIVEVKVGACKGSNTLQEAWDGDYGYSCDPE